MRKFTKFFGSLAVLITTLCATPAQASHFKGGDVYFNCLGNGVYQLVFACYYACESGGSQPYPVGDIFWNLTNSCGTSSTIYAINASTQQDVPFYCAGVSTTCDYPYYNGNTGPAGTPIGTLVVVYTSDTFSIAPGCTVTAEVDQGSRNAAVSNLVGASGYDLDIQATVTGYSSGVCNYNPIFAQYPVNVFCVNQNANFSQGAIDLNGDSLVYTLINPRTTGGTPIPFVAGCSATNPLGAPNVFASVFTFDSHTGNINFTPTATGGYVLAVQVTAYHNGVITGTTMRDIQFTVVTCTTVNSPPTLASLLSTTNVTGGVVIDSTHVGVCPGEPLQITLTGVNSQLNSFVIDSTNAATSLIGSTVTFTNSNTPYDTARTIINWTPQNSDSGFHYILFTVKDTNCPIPGRQTFSFVVSVLTGLYAGPNLVYCNGGDPVTIYAHGANHYLWTDSATGGAPVGVIAYGPDSSYITVAPGSTSGYIVVGDLLGSCKNSDTVKVVNAPLFALSTSTQDTSVCKYTSTILTATPNPTSVGPFVYSWTPATAVVSPTSASTVTTRLLNSTWYYVAATAGAGCTIRDSVYVAVSGAAPRINILPSNNNVCPGDTVSLFAQVVVENLVACGPQANCDPTSISTETMSSNDTSSNSSSLDFYEDPSPFQGSENSFIAQYLFRASELNAAGISSGTITDIAFFMKQINSTTPYDSFSVSVGCTNIDSLTGIIGGLTNVFYGAGPNAITPTLGWTGIPFINSLYGWDGSSNLVIQVCYTIDPNVFSNDDFCSYVTTPYMGSSFINSTFSGQNGCNITGLGFPGGPLNTRPVIRFGMCTPNAVSYQWSPTGTLICDTCPLTAIQVLHDSTVVSVRVSDYVCTNDTSLTLHINPYLALAATPDTSLCSPDTVHLNLTLTTAPPPVCLQDYFVTSIPYNAISGSPINIAANSFNESGFNSDDDGVSGPINIGFTFPFYCQDYTQFYACTNGWVSLVPPNSTTYIAQYLPPTAANLDPQKMITWVMGDWTIAPTGSGTINYFTSGTAPNRVLVIQYSGISSFLGGYTGTGEIHLYENGIIEILVQSCTYANKALTIGIKDTTGIGVAAPGRDDQIFTLNTPEAWRFTPDNGAPVFISGVTWSPTTTMFPSDTIINPYVAPASTQIYTATTTVTINRFTNPTQCVVHAYDTVRISPPIASSLTAARDTMCPGDTTHLTFTPDSIGTTFVWTPINVLNNPTIGDPIASILMDSTKISVIATNSYGCVMKDTITLHIFAVQHVDIGSNQTVCYDSIAVLTVHRTDSAYQWYEVNNVNGVRTPIPGATSPSYSGAPGEYYILQVIDTGVSCAFYSNIVHIDSFARQHVSVIASGPETFCVGSSVTLQVSQGVDTNSIIWTPASYGSSYGFAAYTAGQYYYSALDAHGCLEHSDTVTVAVTPDAVVTATSSVPVICVPGGSSTLTATVTPSGVSLYWVNSSGAQVATGSTYTATTPDIYQVKTGSGCADSASINLQASPAPFVNPEPVPQPICSCTPNQLISAFVGAPNVSIDSNKYQWTDVTHGITYTTPTFIDTFLGTTSYTLDITDSVGCTASFATPFTVTITCPNITITASKDTMFRNGDSVILTAHPGSGAPSALTYSWTPVASVSSPTDTETAVHAFNSGGSLDTFFVMVTDGQCTETFSKTVFIIDSGNFVMATAFTPNGDGINDYFYPVLNGGTSSPARVSSFTIFNQWGQEVYDNPNSPGWDGNFAGAPQASSTYVYFMTVQYPDPQNTGHMLTRSVTGSVQLFR